MRELFGSEAHWCWHPEIPFQTPCYVLFRREFRVSADGALRVSVTADHRYTLYLDGRLLGRGPCRSDLQHYRYETYETPLAAGAHVLAARAVVFPPHGADGDLWCTIAEMHLGGGFLVAGGVFAGDEKVVALDTPAGWQCRREAEREHRSPAADHRQRHGVVPPMETYTAPPAAGPDWRAPGGGGAGWTAARGLWPPTCGPVKGDPPSRWWLTPRTVPQGVHTAVRVARVVRIAGLADPAPVLRGFASERGPAYGPLDIPAGAEVTITLDLGVLTTAFPRLVCRGAAGTRIRMAYAESLFVDGRKRERDHADGVVEGYSDVILAGPAEAEFEPFWFRTFRFVELRITTPAGGGATLCSFSVASWMYPFELKAAFDAGDEDLQRIWEIGWRTARLCAHEHYEDCPYYEQLQYAGDTRIQALISYWATGDGRLGRQAIEQFDWSRLPEGITQSRYPSNWMQVIPGFSLYWILMVWDHYLFFGDAGLVRAMQPGIQAVLDWFERRVAPGGLVGALPYWGFHDWVEGWPRGCPDRSTGRPATLDTLLYAVACGAAAFLVRECGDDAAARRLRARQRRAVAAVKRHCFDARRRLFVDVPGMNHVSQHTNAMAILAGAAQGRRALALGRRVAAGEGLNPATLYYSFYLFRAWEAAGCYDCFWQQLERWKSVLRWNFTTFPEIPSPESRSDCHAWSASPLYELLALVLGVRPGAPGFRALLLQPHPGPLRRAEGRACLPDQTAAVRWALDESGTMRLAFALERALPVTVAWPDGHTQALGTVREGEVTRQTAGRIVTRGE